MACFQHARQHRPGFQQRDYKKRLDLGRNCYLRRTDTHRNLRTVAKCSAGIDRPRHQWVARHTANEPATTVFRTTGTPRRTLAQPPLPICSDHNGLSATTYWIT